MRASIDLTKERAVTNEAADLLRIVEINVCRHHGRCLVAVDVICDGASAHRLSIDLNDDDALLEEEQSLPMRKDGMAHGELSS